MLQEFKLIVDSVSDTISQFNNDHQLICDHLGIDTTNGYSSDWVVKKFRENIKSLLLPNHDSFPHIKTQTV
jgi:hypothetical protein